MAKQGKSAKGAINDKMGKSSYLEALEPLQL